MTGLGRLTLAAKTGCFIFLLAVPVAIYFAWPKANLVGFVILAVLPIKFAMLSFVWPRARVLSGVALISNALFAIVSAYAFIRMALNVRAPPNIVSTLPVLLVAYMLLVTPVLNVVAIWRHRVAVSC